MPMEFVSRPRYEVVGVRGDRFAILDNSTLDLLSSTYSTYSDAYRALPARS